MSSTLVEFAIFKNKIDFKIDDTPELETKGLDRAIAKIGRELTINIGLDCFDRSRAIALLESLIVIISLNFPMSLKSDKKRSNDEEMVNNEK